MENSMEIPKKIKNRITISSSSFIPGYLSEENENIRKDVCSKHSLKQFLCQDKVEMHYQK